MRVPGPETLLGGSWVVISGVISKASINNHIQGLITKLITTHEPPGIALLNRSDTQG